MPHEHRTGNGSYMPCGGTLLPCAMPKLLHDATSFDLLPPGVELDKVTLRANVAYCVRVVEVMDPTISHNRQRRVVEGTWLGAELLARGGPVDNSTTYQVRSRQAWSRTCPATTHSRRCPTRSSSGWRRCALGRPCCKICAVPAVRCCCGTFSMRPEWLQSMRPG